MNLAEEEDELDKLQLQTRDPFQLELIDAVKRRQRRETGFIDDVDKSTQRHSKAMDVKMSKYLSNKQSPFHRDNSLGESSSLKGDTGKTMYLGSTGGVNNTLTTTGVHNSKWKPSSVIDSDDDISEDFSTDDEDDIVIGSNARIPREDTKVTKKASHDSETQGYAEYGDFRHRTSDILAESGLKQAAGGSSQTELDNLKRSQPKESKIEPKSKESSERPGIQRRREFGKEEEPLEAKVSSSSGVSQETRKVSSEGLGIQRRRHFGTEEEPLEAKASSSPSEVSQEARRVSSERLGIQKRKPFGKEEEPLKAKYSSSSAVSYETRKSSTEESLNREVSMERPAFGRRGKFGTSIDSDEEVSIGNERSIEKVESLSQKESKIDDIFEYGVARKQDSLQHIDDNLRQINKSKSRGETSGHENPIDFGRKSGTQSPRSRSGSGKEIQLDTIKSGYKKSSSGDNDIHNVNMHASNRPTSRTNSGKNTPETGKTHSISGRSSPADGLLSSVSRELSKSERKVGTLKDDTQRSRSGSGRDSESLLLLSQSKEETVPKEKTGRPKSAKVRESDRSKLPSSSGKSTPEAGKSRSLSGRSSPADGLISSVSRELSKSEGKVSASDDGKPRSRSGPGRSSESHLILSQSKDETVSREKTERPKSAKVQEGPLEGGSRHVEKEPDRRLPSRGSKDEIKQMGGTRSGGTKQRSHSPEIAGKTSLSHRRSRSIGNSPREMEDSKGLAPPSDTFGSRGRSRSDAMMLDDRNASVRAKDNECEEDRGQRDAKRLGSKYSLKRPGSIRSMNNRDVGSDSDDDDEEFIGIRRSNKTSQKKSDSIDPRSEIIDDRKATPNIKRPLRTEMLTAEKSRSKESGNSNGDHGINSGSSLTKSRSDTSSKAGNDPLSKFKIKGRGEAPQSKTTPVKPNKDINIAQSTAGRSSPNRKVKHATAKRSLSFTNISNIKPRSPYIEIEADTSRRGNSMVDSEMLREQIYYDWLQQKSTKTKQDIKELRRMEKEKDEEAEREKEDKKIMSQKAFEAWTADKQEGLKAKRSEIKEKKLKEKEKEDEELQKKLDSKKHFESWKSNKEKELIEHRQKLKEEKREKRRKEFEDQEEKRSSSKKVYENWKSKKEELLKDKLKEKKEQEKQRKLEEIEKMEKKRKAEKLFETWKETKQKSPREKTVLTQRAWCPSGRNSQNTIPENVKPVVQRNPPNRSRTLSATARLQSRTMNSTFSRT